MRAPRARAGRRRRPPAPACASRTGCRARRSACHWSRRARGSRSRRPPRPGRPALAPDRYRRPRSRCRRSSGVRRGTRSCRPCSRAEAAGISAAVRARPQMETLLTIGRPASRARGPRRSGVRPPSRKPALIQHAAPLECVHRHQRRLLLGRAGQDLIQAGASSGRIEGGRGGRATGREHSHQLGPTNQQMAQRGLAPMIITARRRPSGRAATSASNAGRPRKISMVNAAPVTERAQVPVSASAVGSRSLSRSAAGRVGAIGLDGGVHETSIRLLPKFAGTSTISLKCSTPSTVT